MGQFKKISIQSLKYIRFIVLSVSTGCDLQLDPKKTKIDYVEVY